MDQARITLPSEDESPHWSSRPGGCGDTLPSVNLIDQLRENCATIEAAIVTAEREIALLRNDIERSSKPKN